MTPRVNQDIRDIADAQQLIRFALGAQMALLDEDDITQTDVAHALGKDRAYVTHALEGHPKTLSDKQLRDLDEAIAALDPAVGDTGGLSSLSIRLRGLSDSTSLSARAPCAWTREMLEHPPLTEFDVLIRASALLATFMTVEKAKKPIRPIRLRYESEISKLVEKFILIGGAPPTPRNSDALVLFGGLVKYCSQSTYEFINETLRSFPLGFRIWRTVTALVQLSRKNAALAKTVQDWVRELFDEAEQLRTANVYPGRSLDLEPAIAVPSSWSPPGDEDWVHNFLLARARSENATVEERSTAAHGLWKRAFAESGEYKSRAKDELGPVIKDFRSPDAAAGLRWAAATLERVLEDNEQVCNKWPDIDEPWLQMVHETADSLDRKGIPENIRNGVKVLFKHTLLQNAAAERREAIDTLVAAGWTEPVVNALKSVLAREKTTVWLRTRALFALGFLQRRDLTVAQTLTAACKEAHQRINGNGRPPTAAEINEMHAALFAIGDCFGNSTPETQRAIREVRSEIGEFIRSLIADGWTAQPEEHRPVARAAAYMLTATAADRLHPDKKDISQELLESLRAHPDPMTKRLSQWALSFRFNEEDGKVCPLLHGPVLPGSNAN